MYFQKWQRTATAAFILRKVDVIAAFSNIYFPSSEVLLEKQIVNSMYGILRPNWKTFYARSDTVDETECLLFSSEGEKFYLCQWLPAPPVQVRTESIGCWIHSKSSGF